jgi:hypothetical protein
MKISRTAAQTLIRRSKGKFFGVTFVKKNGEVREMNARLGVKKGVTGAGMKYNPAEHDLITAFDVAKNNFRMINVRTLQRLSLEGQTYEIV